MLTRVATSFTDASPDESRCGTAHGQKRQNAIQACNLFTCAFAQITESGLRPSPDRQRRRIVFASKSDVFADSLDIAGQEAQKINNFLRSNESCLSA